MRGRYRAQVRLGRFAGAGVVEDAHFEAGGAPGNCLADFAEADDAEGRAEDVDTEEAGWRPGLPAAGAGIAVAGDDVARGRHEQGPGHVGGGLGKNAGGVGDPDAKPGRRRGIDVVVADCHVRDDLEAGGCSKHIRGDEVDDGGESGIGGDELCCEGLGRGRQIAGPGLDRMASGGEQLDGPPGNGARNEDVSHGESLGAPTRRFQ